MKTAYPTQRMTPLAQKLIEAVGQSVHGKEDVIELAVITLFAGGHLLIEDLPGVGKTLLARSLAQSLDLPFQRIQCTADLLPSDLIGAQIYHPRTGELTFRQGPVFTSVLMADELNRTPPRTQSALLECMAERSVTVDRDRHILPDPFFVVATQNPLTAAGTYLLPDNQLDRFLLRIEMGHLDSEFEIDVVSREDGHRSVEDCEPVASKEELLVARQAIDNVRCNKATHRGDTQQCHLPDCPNQRSFAAVNTIPQHLSASTARAPRSEHDGTGWENNSGQHSQQHKGSFQGSARIK